MLFQCFVLIHSLSLNRAYRVAWLGTESVLLRTYAVRSSEFAHARRVVMEQQSTNASGTDWVDWVWVLWHIMATRDLVYILSRSGVRSSRAGWHQTGQQCDRDPTGTPHGMAARESGGQENPGLKMSQAKVVPSSVCWGWNSSWWGYPKLAGCVFSSDNRIKIWMMMNRGSPMT